MLSKSLSTSEKFASLITTAPDLYEFCHALYPLMLTHTDDFGRLQGDPFTVKHVCYPASPRSLEEFAAGLTALHDVELVIWYAVAGKKYLQIQRFDPHQSGLHKRTRSAFPRVPEDSGNLPELAVSETFPEIPGQLKGTKENLTKENRNKDIQSRYATFAEEFPAERRVGGKKAKEAFGGAFEGQADIEAHFQRMMAALRQHKRSRQWSGPEPKIPLMTTWLHQERWNQILPETSKPGGSGGVPNCHHKPPCTDPAAHTKRDLHERTRGAA